MPARHKAPDWYVIRKVPKPTTPPPSGPVKTGPQPRYGVIKGHEHDIYEVSKFTDEGEWKGNYLLAHNLRTKGITCTCPAAAHHRQTCRHTLMFAEFVRNQAIDSGAMFQYDTGVWKAPIPPGEE